MLIYGLAQLLHKQLRLFCQQIDSRLALQMLLVLSDAGKTAAAVCDLD